MSSRNNRKLLPSILLLASLLGARTAEAQSFACESPSLLGTSGLAEMCVVVYDDAIPVRDVEYFPSSTFPFPVAGTVGEYDIDLVADYTFGPLGMSILIGGTVTRSAPGTGRITVVADAGWGMPLAGSLITLNLDGASTGTSLTVVGGAAGVPVGTTPAEDLTYSGSPVPLTIPTSGAQPFVATYTHGKIIEDAVAIRALLTFHINEVGVEVVIPAGAGLVAVDEDGNPIGGGFKDKPHFRCYSVGGPTQQQGAIIDEPTQQRERNVDMPVPRPDPTVVSLKDQFAFVETRLGAITRLCTPVSKNEEDVPDPELHLVCYEIADGHDPNELVQAMNQFGEATVHVRESRELCVPSTKKRFEEQKEQQQQAEESAG